MAMHLDPALFRPESISDETNEFNNQLKMVLEAAPSIATMEPQAIRDGREQGESIWGPPIYSDMAETAVVPGPAGEIPIRVFRGERVYGIYLHFHGGGFVLGSEDLFDPAHEAMVNEAGVAVVSVGYRLAPEHPYPAGVDDCEAATAWIVENAGAEFGTDTIITGGESAGAHLAVATMLRMRDRHGYTGFAGANLVYGGYVVDATPSSRNWDRGNLILDQEILAWFHRLAFPSSIDPTDPDAAPLYADLTSMPPALFTVGTYDPLLDNTLMMAARWAAAGIDADLAVYPGGIHAFDAFAGQLEIARQARDGMHKWVESRSRSTQPT
jgi:acetyl esterase/lipase